MIHWPFPFHEVRTVYYHLNIHRLTLRKTLHLPEKISAAFEGRFTDVPCYRHAPQPGDDDPLYPALIGRFTVVVHKSGGGNGRKSSQHRVFVACACGREVPAGRMAQHRCAHWPTPELVALEKARRERWQQKEKLRKEQWLNERTAALSEQVRAGVFDADHQKFLSETLWKFGISEQRRLLLASLYEQHADKPPRERMLATVADFAVQHT